MFPRYLGFNIFCWTYSKGLKIAGDVCPLSSRWRAYTLLNFIDSGMCFPAIVFIILKISHVFSRYRSIAGKHIKNRPHTLKFRGFLQNLFGRFSRLAVPQSTYIPREPQCLSPRPNWDSPPPLLQAIWRGGGSQFGRLEKRLSTLSILCGLSKIRENIHLKRV